MESITFQGVPTFRILDVAAAKAFYIDRLGFQMDWEHYFAPGAPVYMQVSRNGLVLHLSANTRYKEGSIAFVETTGIDGFRREIAARTRGSIPELEQTPWGTTQLELEDPWGNQLRFNESSSETKEQPKP